MTVRRARALMSKGQGRVMSSDGISGSFLFLIPRSLMVGYWSQLQAQYFGSCLSDSCSVYQLSVQVTIWWSFLGLFWYLTKISTLPMRQQFSLEVPWLLQQTYSYHSKSCTTPPDVIFPRDTLSMMHPIGPPDSVQVFFMFSTRGTACTFPLDVVATNWDYGFCSWVQSPLGFGSFINEYSHSLSPGTLAFIPTWAVVYSLVQWSLSELQILLTPGALWHNFECPRFLGPVFRSLRQGTSLYICLPVVHLIQLPHSVSLGTRC